MSFKHVVEKFAEKHETGMFIDERIYKDAKCSPKKLSHPPFLPYHSFLSPIVFVPGPNRTHEGKQIYKFGRCSVVIVQDTLMRQEGGGWVEVSLNELLKYK